VASVDLSNGEILLTAAEQSKADPKRLLNLLHQAGGGMRVSPDH